MSAETTTERGAGADAGTELGLSPELEAVLGYLFNVVGAVVLLVVEDNEFVRHHAAQSLLFTGVAVVASVVAGFVGGILGFVPVVGGALELLVTLGVRGGILAGFLLLMYRAYSGERYRLPVVGDYIEDVEGVF